MKNFLSIRKKRIVIAILTIILLGSCGGVFSKVKKSNYPTPVQEDPYLNLTLLVAFGKDVSYNEINVENDCIKIGAKDIKAFFDYGTLN